MDTKTCKRCGVSKPVNLFKRDTRYLDRVSSYCKACHAAASVAWQKANPDKVNTARRLRYARKKEQINANRKKAYDPEKARALSIYYRYKMSIAEYNAILMRQGGCAICHKSPIEDKRAFHVDHDHNCCSGVKTCGKCVRGILCHSCNVTLAAIEADPEWHQKAIQYLKGKGHE